MQPHVLDCDLADASFQCQLWLYCQHQCIQRSALATAALTKAGRQVFVTLNENDKPVLDVKVAPALEVSYLAAEGVGAFKVKWGEVRKPIRVAGKPPEGGVWRVVGSRSHPSPDLAEWLAKLGPHDIVPMGSSLKLCLVAEGAADVYPRLGPTCLWDTAAAQAVVEQAGGRVETLEGETLSYASPHNKLNPYFVAWGCRRTPALE